MKLTGIVAMTKDRVIGRDGTLPWHLPEDLAFFKKNTSGHAIVMGRKTFDSIGRPLPKRRNIVITRDQSWRHEGVEVISSIDQLKIIIGETEDEVFIIGGAQIYDLTMNDMSSLLITHVKENFSGDTCFPAYQEIFPVTEIILETEQFIISRHSRK
jgi:dihydrofolate reductase